MADFDLSMVVRARDEGAVATGTAVAGAMGSVARAEDQAAAAANRLRGADETASASARRLGQSMGDQAAQMRANADAINQVVRATNPAASSQQLLEAAVRRVQNAYLAGKVGADVYARAQEIAARATRENVQWQNQLGRGMGQSRVGTMMLGQQIQDVGMQLALGTDALRVFAMQAGQTALAVQQMGGRFSGFAAFIGGPWGSLLLAGISILALFSSQLLANAEAAEAAEVGADGLSSAQSVLGEMFDLTSGKIERQNALLRANIALTAVNLQAEALREREQARETYQNLGYRGNSARLATIGESISRGVAPWRIPEIQRRADRYSAQVQRLLTDVGQGRMSSEAALQASARIDFSTLNVTREQFQQAVVGRLSATAKEDTSRRMLESLRSGVLDPVFRRDGGGGRKPHGRSNNEAERLEEFGEDAARRIAGLAGGFVDTPTQIEKVRSSLAQLDDILDDVERRRPPNFKELLRQGEEARAVIQDGINKPFRDFLAAQNDALQVQRLLSRGRVDEADALRIILRLQEQQGPLGEEREATILASVQALRAEQREMEILHEQQQRQLNALNDIKETILDTLREGLSNIDQVPQRLLAAFNNYTAEYLFDQFFGETFRELQDQINGTTIAEDAAERFRDAVQGAETATASASTALDRFTTSLDRASGAVGGGAPGFTGPPGTTTEPSALLAELFGLPGVNRQWNPIASGDGGDGQIVTVTGARRRDTVPRDPAAFFSYVIEKLARGVLGPDAARAIGTVAGKGLEGAAMGGMVAGVGRLFGLKTSNTGGQIGGAIGGFAASAVGLPPIVGQLLGGLFGSTIGGLFKSTKTGTATITSAYDSASLGGNNAGMRDAAGGLASTVQDTILNIAERLGGGVGSFSVSIGQRDGKWRVDPTGSGQTKTKRGAKDFGEDQAAATAYAVMDALRDGAVTGLSAAVSSALKSSPDVERALREALKVSELETLIGGLGSQLTRQFKDFDRVAEERVRLAKKYGLDVLAVEKINADERVKLIKASIQSRVGSLLDFQKDLTYGDLYEGDAPTRRAAILADIGDVQQEAEAGIEGAADRLAELYRLLIGTSEEAYGTAGPELTADRAAAAEGVARVIQMENERIAAAAGLTQAQLDALIAGNTLADENNALVAGTNGRLDTVIGLLGGGSGDTPAQPTPVDIGLGGLGLGGFLGGVGRFTNMQLV